MKRRCLVALLAAPALAADGLDAIERESGGRLGVMATDLASGRRIAHRADERFPMTSTFKALLAAAALAGGAGMMARNFTIPRDGLIPWSPVTQSRGGESMSGRELCAVTLATSDNTAANLLLEGLGGPQALTRWLRETGDPTTRLDRTEPTLNEARPGDARDTTTPDAMARTLARVTLAGGTPEPGRAQLLAWMRAHRFGGSLLRAGMPGWSLADRSGAGGFNSRGIIGVAYPPSGAPPWVIAAYLHEGPAAMAARDALLARVGAMVASTAR